MPPLVRVELRVLSRPFSSEGQAHRFIKRAVGNGEDADQLYVWYKKGGLHGLTWLLREEFG